METTGWFKTFLPLCWRCPAAPHSLRAGPQALGGGNCVFQHFPDTYTLVIFKNASLIQSFLGAQGGPGQAHRLCRLRLPLVTELPGKAGESVCVWGGEYGEAAGYFGRCKRGANSPAFIFQPAGADSGCFCSDNCVELSHRGLGYTFRLQLRVQQRFTSLIILFLAAWDTGGAFRRSNKMGGG